MFYNKDVHEEFHKAERMIEHLWEYFVEDVDRFYENHWPGALKDGTPAEDIRDFLAGMTDAFAVSLHDEVFTPRRWYVL